MIKLNFVHLCEYAFIERNGTPGIIGIFSSIKSKQEKISFNAFVVINFNPDDVISHTIGLKIKSPSGDQIYKSETMTVGPATDETKYLGVIIPIQNAPLQGIGEYNIEIYIDNNGIKTLPFNFELDR